MAAENNSGWMEYFTQISTFLIACERRYGIANINYCEYAIERLSIISHGLRNVAAIVNAEGQAGLNEIEESMYHLQRVVDRILDLYKNTTRILRVTATIQLLWWICTIFPHLDVHHLQLTKSN